MQFSITHLLSLFALIASYFSLLLPKTLLQILLAAAISQICLGVTAVLISRPRQTTDSRRELHQPWTVLIVGAGLMILGLFAYFPIAIEFASQKYRLAVKYGYPTGPEADAMVGISICLYTFLIGFPATWIMGMIGNKFSDVYGVAGIGRYTCAISLSALPVIAGTYFILHYCLIAEYLKSGG